MAVSVLTSMPSEIIEDFKSLIDAKIIDTWVYDDDGDFTLLSPRWNRIAWFHPIILNDRIIFGIIGRKGFNISIEEYGVYHGQLVESLVTHYIRKVNSISILKPEEYNVDTDKIDF